MDLGIATQLLDHFEHGLFDLWFVDQINNQLLCSFEYSWILNGCLQELNDLLEGAENSRYGIDGELYALKDVCYDVEAGKYTYDASQDNLYLGDVLMTTTASGVANNAWALELMGWGQLDLME